MAAKPLQNGSAEYLRSAQPHLICREDPQRNLGVKLTPYISKLAARIANESHTQGAGGRPASASSTSSSRNPTHAMLPLYAMAYSSNTEAAMPNRNYVLVKAAAWGDAEFYGRWLLAAAQAEAFWKEALKEPEFEKQTENVRMFYIPDFGIAASMMLTQLGEYRTSYLISLDSEEFELFAMMALMGFFLPTDRHYNMAIPANLTKAEVKAAMIKYAETEDKEFMLHPERLVGSMLFSEARAWQRRWRAIDEFDGHSETLGRA